MLVAALYNIVDQIFIANASYLGSYGNAANTVVFPLTVIALAIAVIIGDGCCAYVSICLGAQNQKNSHRGIGNTIVLCVGLSLAVTAVYFLFQNPILITFGGRVNEETFILSKEYFFYITTGIPFYMFGQAMNPVIRSDGSPRFAMISTLAGAAANIILDPIFIFGFHWGMMGAAVATVAGQVLTAGLAVWYLCHLQSVRLEKGSFQLNREVIFRFISLGICKLFTYLLVWEAIVGAVSLFIAEYLSGQIIQIFGAANESSYYTEFVLKAFRIYLCMMIPACINKAAFIYLQSLGKALLSTMLSIFREVVFGAGFALLLPLFFGLDGVLYSMPVSGFLTFLISAATIIYTYRTLREPENTKGSILKYS